MAFVGVPVGVSILRLVILSQALRNGTGCRLSHGVSQDQFRR